MGSNSEKPCFGMNEHPIAAVKLLLRLSTTPGHFISIWRGPRVDFYRKIVKTKVVELDEPVNSKPVTPSDLFF